MGGCSVHPTGLTVRGVYLSVVGINLKVTAPRRWGSLLTNQSRTSRCRLRR